MHSINPWFLGRFVVTASILVGTTLMSDAAHAVDFQPTRSESKHFWLAQTTSTCPIGGGTPDSNITAYISDEVSAGGTAVNTLDDAWRTAAKLPQTGTIKPWFGTAASPLGNTGTFPTFTTNGVNVTAKLVNMNAVDSCTGVENVTGTGTNGSKVDFSANLQAGAPRPGILSGADQPGFWNELAGNNGNRNAVLFVFDKDISAFGAWFGDLETRSAAANGTPAILRLLDAAGNRIGSDIPINPTTSIASQNSCNATANGCGNNTTRWVGFVDKSATPRVRQVLVIVGDPDAIGTGSTGKGFTEHISFIGADILLSTSGSDPNILLVKRITAINGGTTTINGDDLAIYYDTASPYDDNVPESTPFVGQPNPNQKDTTFWPNPANFLLGGTNGGNIKPNDRMEYTIYFLSSGDTPAKNVELCDRIPEGQSFEPTAFNSVTAGLGGSATADRGILIFTNNALRSYTNLVDGDSASYYAPGQSLPASCGMGGNSNGTIVVNLGNVPNATTPGLPIDSHGFVRFRVRVN
jgi:uncharacterized repeat protein (TIGR01451 family)